MRRFYFISTATALAFIFSSATLQADVLHVPDDYGTIQGAIDAAKDFD